MDNSDTRFAERVCFGPDRRMTALCAGLAAIGVAATLLTNDRAGQLLFAVAAIILAAYVVTDLRYSPRLTASAEGLEIRTPTVRGRFAWPDVASVRADSRQRAGLRLVTLEVEVADMLVVFSRRALGADPELVASRVRLADPR